MPEVTGKRCVRFRAEVFCGDKGERMKISAAHAGGNIVVRGIDGDCVYVEPELRDTDHDWFYWNFCVEGAQGRTLTFDFAPKRWVGWHGAAVSRDNESWRWTHTAGEDGSSFTYTFGPDEDRVYFCHDMYYSVARFEQFAQRKRLDVFPFSRTRKGREVPCTVVGEGDKWILLTSRHHCCESTGTYAMEGMIEQYLQHPIEGYRLMCVPFVDMDGAMDGDQGKYRAPHDHEADYLPAEQGGSLYPETRAVMRFIEENDVEYCIDLHSPWHRGKRNDQFFLSCPSFGDNERVHVFSQCLREAAKANPEAPFVDGSGDIEYGREWNLDPEGERRFSRYAAEHEKVRYGVAIESAYFGLPGNEVSPKKLIAWGRCILEGLRTFIRENY